MNPMDWLKSVRENGEKSLIPPVPPEAPPVEKGQKAQNPPEPPCSSLYLKENGKTCNEGSKGDEQQDIWWGEETEDTSGCHRGNQGISCENEDSGLRGLRGNQGNTGDFALVEPMERPRKPFLTAGGDLRIPFDSDPKYHWWKGGQSPEETIAELKAERATAEGGEPAEVPDVGEVRFEPGGKRMVG